MFHKLFQEMFKVHHKLPKKSEWIFLLKIVNNLFKQVIFLIATINSSVLNNRLIYIINSFLATLRKCQTLSLLQIHDRVQLLKHQDHDNSNERFNRKKRKKVVNGNNLGVPV